MTIDELRNRYIALFGLEPAEGSKVGLTESGLDVRLPEDFKRVSEFYSGGTLGGISHYSLGTILRETTRLRNAVGLPHSFVMLAEPPASLIVMNTASSSPAVIWCDAVDVSRLSTLQNMHDPQTWNSYLEFFEFLLDTEEEEREA